MKRIRVVAALALVAAGVGETPQLPAAPGTLSSGDGEIVLPARKKRNTSASVEADSEKEKSGDESRTAKPAASPRARSKSASPEENRSTEEPKPEPALASAVVPPSERGNFYLGDNEAADPASADAEASSDEAEALSEEELAIPAPKVARREEAPEPVMPARPASEPKKGLFSRALSGILPGKSDASSRTAAPAFNTDYRTRSANTIVPVSIAGKGLGGADIPIGLEDAYRKSLPSDFCPTDLLRISPDLCLTSGQPIFLRREAAQSLERMFRDARAEGLKLQVFSGYRDYAHQARLYAEAVRKRGPNQKTVARPGRSEHFLGTTADVTNGQPRHLLSRSFANSPEGRWLEKNAARYGWKMTVRSGPGKRSHADEPWHIRYLGSGSAEEGTLARAKSPSLMKRVGRFIGIGREK